MGLSGDVFTGPVKSLNSALKPHFSAASAPRVSIPAETREGGEQMKITITKVEKIEATRPHLDPNAVA